MIFYGMNWLFKDFLWYIYDVFINVGRGWGWWDVIFVIDRIDDGRLDWFI